MGWDRLGAVLGSAAMVQVHPEIDERLADLADGTLARARPDHGRSPPTR